MIAVQNMNNGRIERYEHPEDLKLLLMADCHEWGRFIRGEQKRIRQYETLKLTIWEKK